MGDVLDVLFLAGRHATAAPGRALTPLLDALAGRAIRPRVICLARGPADRADPRILEYPGLGNRWLRAIRLRQLGRVENLGNASVLHVLHERMNPLALALVDAWDVPYFLGLDEVGARRGGLRLDCRRCRGLIVPTAEQRARLVGELGVPAELVRVIAPGLVPRAEPRRSWDASIPVVGTAVAAADDPALGTFLGAARQVVDRGRDVEFLIACPDADPSELRRAAREHGMADRVSVVDPAFLEARFWTVLDVFCHAAPRAAPAGALMRAMAEGIASLATQAAEVSGLIEQGRSGLLVPPGDPGAMAAALLRLLEDPPAALDLGRQGQQVIRARFSLDVEADLLAALYRSCVPPGPGPAG